VDEEHRDAAGIAINGITHSLWRAVGYCQLKLGTVIKGVPTGLLGDTGVLKEVVPPLRPGRRCL